MWIGSHRKEIRKLTFRALAPCQRKSDEGLTLETSAFESLYSSHQFTLITLLIKLNYLVITKYTDNPLKQSKLKENYSTRIARENGLDFTPDRVTEWARFLRQYFSKLLSTVKWNHTKHYFFSTQLHWEFVEFNIKASFTTFLIISEA